MRFLTWLPLAALAIIPTNRLPEVALCGFRWLTGLPCPLCGLTHALSYLLHGEIREAATAHPLSPLVTLMMLSYPFLDQIWLQKRRNYLAGGVFLLFGIYGFWRCCAIILAKG